MNDAAKYYHTRQLLTGTAGLLAKSITTKTYEKLRNLRKTTSTSGGSTVVCKQPDNSKENVVTPRCYNCRKMGHTQNQCRLPTRPPGSCFRCFKDDYLYQNCPQRVQQVAATVQAYEPEEEEQNNNSPFVMMNVNQEKDPVIDELTGHLIETNNNSRMDFDNMRSLATASIVKHQSRCIFQSFSQSLQLQQQ